MIAAALIAFARSKSGPPCAPLRTGLALALWLLGLGSGAVKAGEPPTARSDRLLEIRTLTVNGLAVPLSGEGTVRLSSKPHAVTFGFGPSTNNSADPMRMRYRLEGYDEAWRRLPGVMSLAVRFTDQNQDQAGERAFVLEGESPGWTGALETTPFVHREETFIVPPKARSVWIAISSAGPPNAVGVVAITNLTLKRLSAGNEESTNLIEWGPSAAGQLSGNEWVPTDWTRNGLRPGMAKVLPAGPGGQQRALVLLDNDASAHAEWAIRKEAGPAVSPGDHLRLEWDEALSIGLAGPSVATYPELPPGFYHFRVGALSLMGLPTEAEAALTFEVPLPIWKLPWFWGMLVLLLVSAAAAAYRYAAAREMRLRLARLESQRALEHERLRIARDIHDDLGARVTQMSLVSGLAQSDPTLSEKARSDFNTISSMSRDLVAALYETVWAVNPENDNLDELANYLCQMVVNLCDKAQLRHRLKVAELPRDLQLSSHVRHELVMAVKEAVHNVIKHAHASEVSVQVMFEEGMLVIRVQDDGSGFKPDTVSRGNGIANMERRLEVLGGTCTFETTPGEGATVCFRAPIAGAAAGS